MHITFLVSVAKIATSYRIKCGSGLSRSIAVVAQRLIIAALHWSFMPALQTGIWIRGELITAKCPSGCTIGGYYYAAEDVTANLDGARTASSSTLQTVNAALQSAVKSPTTAMAN